MKTKTEINPALLQLIINKYQDGCANISALCEQAATLYNSQKDPRLKAISSAVIRLHLEKYKTVKTTVKKGERGKFFVGKELTAEHKEKMLAGRKKTTRRFDRAAMLKDLPGEEELIDRVCSGSMKSAILAKCKECSNSKVQPLEWKKCTITHCPLHGFLKRDMFKRNKP